MLSRWSGRPGCHHYLEPATQKIIYLVVAESNAPDIKRLIPPRFIKKTTHRLILLSCTGEAVSKMDQLKKLLINPIDLRINYMVLQKGYL